MNDANANYRTRAVARRRFLAYVGAVVVAGASARLIGVGNSATRTQAAEAFEHRLVVPGISRALTSTALFFLDPEHGAGTIQCVVPHESSRACHGCVACHNHAENKLFATAKAADAGRAHIGCKCLIGQEQVTVQQFEAVFGVGGSRGVVFDKRKDDLL